MTPVHEFARQPFPVQAVALSVPFSLVARPPEILTAATKLRQGNVFTRVCDSLHRRGGGSVRETPLPAVRYACYWNALFFTFVLVASSVNRKNSMKAIW